MSNPARLLAAVLAGALVTEVLLLRILARAGIYMFKEGSPGALQLAYTVLLRLGEIAFNLAALLAAAVLALAVIRLVREGDRTLRLTGAALAWPLMFTLAQHPWGSSAPLSTLLLVSTFAGLTTVAVVFGLKSRGAGRLALALFWAAAAAALLVKLLPQASIRWGASTALAGELTAGFEVLLFVAPLALIPSAWPGLNKRAAGMAVAAGVLMLAPALAGAPMIPLIANWAFGVTLTAPYLAYVLTGSLTAYLAACLVMARRWGLLLPIAFLLLGHRGLSLTYFNLLALDGILLLGLELAHQARSFAQVIKPPASIPAYRTAERARVAR